jgi:DNA-binding transcriptional LysR family regulator
MLRASASPAKRRMCRPVLHGMQHANSDPMNVERLDLNLLRVFDAVFDDRSLLRAGRRLHLSQSAVSHALARLRDGVGDQLFVRTRTGMEPTARAMAMAPAIRQSLARIHETLGAPPFDPLHTERRFVLAANDAMTSVLVARLSLATAERAPRVSFVVRPSTRIDLAEQIDVGRIDLAVGIFSEVPPRFRSLALGRQDEVILLRRGHPLARRQVRLEDLGCHPLLTVSVGGQEEGAVSGFIVERGLARQSEMFDRLSLERALAGRGVEPRYRLTVAHALSVPMLLRGSDMLSIVPRSLAAEFVRGGTLVARELPYATTGSDVCAVWHQRHEDDAGHRWLRAAVAEAAQSAAAEPASATAARRASPT